MSGIYPLIYLTFVNALGFALMAWDKYRAVSGGWRVPEKTLLGIAVIGGGPGVYAGMRAFRHKTLHRRFSLGVPLIVAAQLAAAYLLQR